MRNNSIYITFNAAAVAAAYVMLGLSLWLAPINIATKGYWAMGVLLLTASLVNLVKFRMDQHIADDTVSRIEQAKNEKILSEYVARD
ncbi:hypothetical protein [Oricola sp.]|uniref:hypothetical protein n=1 Tax=Oricola sp. TaxID=1979950 RepID=UPI0025E04DD7|nr:hypothetical protein [Oricola sp.]MCI5078425.1 hypothetical protein [Oricola sp.]